MEIQRIQKDYEYDKIANPDMDYKVFNEVIEG